MCPSCSMRASCCTKVGPSRSVVAAGGCGPVGRWAVVAVALPSMQVVQAAFGAQALSTRVRVDGPFCGVVRCLYDNRAVSNCIYAAHRAAIKARHAGRREKRVRVPFDGPRGRVPSGLVCAPHQASARRPPQRRPLLARTRPGGVASSSPP